jgi:MraZ protein
MFLGTHVNGLDAKGRVSVPAEFRAVVRAEGLEGVYCWPSPDGEALAGCGEALMARFKAMADGMDIFDPMRDALAHSVFAGVRMLNFDSNGRITLPDAFVEHAGLDGQIAFVGLSDRFELWRPEAYEAHREAQRAILRESRGGRHSETARFNAAHPAADHSASGGSPAGPGGA